MKTFIFSLIVTLGLVGILRADDFGAGSVINILGEDGEEIPAVCDDVFTPAPGIKVFGFTLSDGTQFEAMVSSN